eukprot:9060373-Prorocentrum_lima.AAC.1
MQTNLASGPSCILALGLHSAQPARSPSWQCFDRVLSYPHPRGRLPSARWIASDPTHRPSPGRETG